jgi:hypothetical protein
MAVKTARVLTSGDDGNYTLTVTATQNGTSVHSDLPVTVSPVVSGAIGFSANVQLFGAATYNTDGTVSGVNGVAGTAPNGTIYNFNPDSPDVHTTAHNRGTFTSDFAGFSCSSIECTRDDTALRVIFRKDLTGTLAGRVEVILEMGHPTTGGTAVNLGAFALQILNAAGSPCNIAVYTLNGGGSSWVPNANTLATGAKLVTKMYAPQMGWFSRWRTWTTDGANFYRDAAHVRPEARSPNVAALGPSGLNLLPQFSATQAAKVRAKPTGAGNLFGPFLWPSSATMNGVAGNNFNPSGMNEASGNRFDTGGVADDATIGLICEFSADYLIAGTAAARTSMYNLCEGIGAHQIHVRDLSTGAPADQVTNTSFNPDLPSYNDPAYGGLLRIEPNHMPEVAYVPYLLTGDPYYLEEKQFAVGYHLIWNRDHRDLGWLLNQADPGSPGAPNPGAVIPMFPSYEFEPRGFGWAIRDTSQAMVAIPASVPGWLQPKSYHQSILDQNCIYTENNSGSPTGTGSNNTYFTTNYPNLALLGLTAGSQGYTQGYMIGYKLMGMAFAANQGGRANWKTHLAYAARSAIGWCTNTDKTAGWPANVSSPYEVDLSPYTTDYTPNPAQFASLVDLWNYYWGTAIYGSSDDDLSVNWPGGSVFSAWQPSTNYACNSWIIETRMSGFDPPNAGDIVSLTISGTFTGSPVTVTHTLSSTDVSYIIANAGFAPNASTSPILDDLISKINSSAAGSHGVQADYANHASSGYYFTNQNMHRIYLTLSGVTITVTGSYTSVGPNSASSLYIQPNGDARRNGVGGANLYGRPLGYQCAATGTSASSGGPTGQSFASLVTDGTCKWGFVPELLTFPTLVPSLKLFNYPHPGVSSQYVWWMLAALYMLKDAGVAGIDTCISNVEAVVAQGVVDDSSFQQRYSFAIVSESPPPTGILLTNDAGTALLTDDSKTELLT